MIVALILYEYGCDGAVDSSSWTGVNPCANDRCFSRVTLVAFKLEKMFPADMQLGGQFYIGLVAFFDAECSGLC